MHSRIGMPVSIVASRKAIMNEIMGLPAPAFGAPRR